MNPKARIILVDDESIVRMDIREMLMLEGYNVVAEASNGETALEQTLRHQPDLIVMDIKMPKMDGITASRIIYQTWRIPILLLTAYNQSQFIDGAKEAGIIGYLVKPITESDLAPAIEIALAQAARLRRLIDEKTALQERLKERKLIERAKGVLMNRSGSTEDEAYQCMRSQAMNRQTSLAVVAKKILAGHERDARLASSEPMATRSVPASRIPSGLDTFINAILEGDLHGER
ncbi:ANTAR domain-containing response regulator [Ferroacidibacillus organovorans]|uniref:ANTAR domain-containing response regulator n=1 Tax=Ferroacidibacillus organovorans TaxID=1765683 RepID=UPI0009E69AB7|nr:response regulator [Ferroacidibacillus organovorans]